jgi:hypothetical protein
VPAFAGRGFCNNKNGVVIVKQKIFLLFHSQHGSGQIGNHQVIREEHTTRNGRYTKTTMLG